MELDLRSVSGDNVIATENGMSLPSLVEGNWPE